MSRSLLTNTLSKNQKQLDNVNGHGAMGQQWDTSVKIFIKHFQRHSFSTCFLTYSYITRLKAVLGVISMVNKY